MGRGIHLLAAAAAAFISCRASDKNEFLVRILEKQAPQEAIIELPQDSSPDIRRARIRAAGGSLHVSLDGGPETPRARFTAGGNSAPIRITIKDLKRAYRGELLAYARTEGAPLVIINRVPLADYVVGVVAAECGERFDRPAALRAVALVCSSFARRAPRHEGYDLCDMAHCQLYRGIPPNEGELREVLSTVRELRLRPAEGQVPVFHACCGGVLAHPLAVWGDEPKRRAVPPEDVFSGRALCADSPEYAWTRKVARERIEAVLAGEFGFPDGRVSGWSISRKDAGGRSAAFSFDIHTPSGTLAPQVSALRFASAYGVSYDWRLFRSLLIDDIESDGSHFILRGRGFGHGVGLCMAGCHALAEMGLPEEDILRHYFPGCSVAP